LAKRTKKGATAIETDLTNGMTAATVEVAAAAATTRTKSKTSGRTTKNKTKAAAAAAAAAAITPSQQAELDLVASCGETLTFSAPVISMPAVETLVNPSGMTPLVIQVPHPLHPLGVGSLDSGATTMEGETRKEVEGQDFVEDEEALSNSALDILMYAFSSDGMAEPDLLGEVPVVSQEIQAAGGLFFEAADESARDGYVDNSSKCHSSGVPSFMANKC
jgi:hypothetical protein